MTKPGTEPVIKPALKPAAQAGDSAADVGRDGSLTSILHPPASAASAYTPEMAISATRKVGALVSPTNSRSLPIMSIAFNISSVVPPTLMLRTG